jgi:type II secretory pathway pseudopilin PulG
MFTSIVILIVAASGLISTVLANKRIDKLQEEINNINKASEYISNVNTDNIRGILKELDNLKQVNGKNSNKSI